MKTILDCPINCPYLILYPDTGNAWCVLGFVVSGPIPGNIEIIRLK